VAGFGASEPALRAQAGRSSSLLVPFGGLDPDDDDDDDDDGGGAASDDDDGPGALAGALPLAASTSGRALRLCASAATSMAKSRGALPSLRARGGFLEYEIRRAREEASRGSKSYPLMTAWAWEASVAERNSAKQR